MICVPFERSFREGPAPRYVPGGEGLVGRQERERFPAVRISETGSGFSPAWWYENKDIGVPVSDSSGVRVCPGPDLRPEDLAGRSLPLWYRADTGAGKYRLTVTLTAPEDCGEVLLFVSRRRLVWRGGLKRGEQKVLTALCDVSPIVAVGGGDAAQGDLGRTEDTSVDIAVIGAALTAVAIAPWEGPSLYLMGDSTVTDQPASVPYAPGEVYSGWGQILPLWLGAQYCVSNHAHSGLSTETFRDRGHWALLREQIRPGDLVLAQFGHNDQKRLHLAAERGYRENLLRYIRELRELGARPALVTPLARNTWASPEAYNDMLLPFRRAMERIGEEEGIPVLNLHAAMKDAILTAGLDAARVWFHPCDYTHLNDFGAHMAAGFVFREMVRNGLAEDREIPLWRVHGPLDGLTPPAEDGLTPPAGAPAPLVDYGLIPDAPWPIT